eukprot:Skav236005  [mRNA]  locus=scaffold1815:51822:53870:- [translate_table: standard]
MRLIMRGKMINPDFELVAYEANVNPANNSYPVHLILQLRGGGKVENAEMLTKVKNDVARLLLSLGCDLSETTAFVGKLVDQAGVSAMQSISNLPTSHLKFEAVQKLANTLNMKVPSMQQIKNQRKKNVDKKAGAKQISQKQIFAAQYRIQEGFMTNEDGTPSKPCSVLRKGASGIMLMDAAEAHSWTDASVKLSQDELTLLVIGSCYHCQKSGKARVSVPVYDDDNRPAVLSCCRHDLGNKIASINQPKDVAISVEETTIIAITAFQDEAPEELWKQIVQSPVRASISELGNMGFPQQLPCPPWGRSWRLGTAPSTPELASSVQYHVRVSSKGLKDLLKISGHKGIYLTPKTDGKIPNGDFGVILDQLLDQLKVQAASIDDSLGLVKIVKGKCPKPSWGIRIAKEGYDEAFRRLKPGCSKPIQIVVNHIAKISPTPKGATAEDVTRWLVQQSWTAKPIRPLGDSVWLVGFQDRLDETWATWNAQLMLVSWLPPKENRPSSALVAGQAPKKQVATASGNSGEGDAWAEFISKNGSSGLKANPPTGARSAPSQPVVRAIEGPIEDRFKKQDEQLASMQNAIETLNSRIEATQSDQANFQGKVYQDLQKFDSNIQKQIEELSKTFGNSVEKAMANQNKQWSSSMSELKNLILQRPIPKKKAKVTKPEGSKEEATAVEDMSEDDEG